MTVHYILSRASHTGRSNRIRVLFHAEIPQKAADVSQADPQSPSLGSSLARVQSKNADNSGENAQLLVSSGHGDMVAPFAQSFRHHFIGLARPSCREIGPISTLTMQVLLTSRGSGMTPSAPLQTTAFGGRPFYIEGAWQVLPGKTLHGQRA